MSRSAQYLATLLLVLAGGGTADSAPDSQSVVACETLVGLRVLMGDGASDHASAISRLPSHPACRLVSRDRVGVAEHRAMVGGAPFECLVIRDETRCAWVLP
jgi:hypothetical protein